MSGVTQWLERLGLEQYAAVFSEHAIDEEVLAELSDADLKEIGIPLGHRRKLLKAIAQSASSPPARSAVGARLPVSTWSRTPGERKPVTMLFADVAGSTALTEDLDSEETHEVLYGATSRMCQAVDANGGTVCRYMGDGVMAMFGAPVAREGHAVQACQAALDMRAAVRRYSGELTARLGHGLQIRVGLHSGEAVILAVGEGERVEYDATGPTVPLAARMEQNAAPDTILITAATRDLAARRIDAVAQPPIRVKGISHPLPVFQLQRVSAIEETRPGDRRTPFVGREAQRAQFAAVLASCLHSGHGLVLHVRGDPGVGKTRTVEEFSRAAAAQGMTCHRALVLDFGMGKGHDPARTLVRALLGLASSADAQARARGADDTVTRGWLDPEQRVFLNDLLDLDQPLEQRALYDAMDNPRRNRGKQEVLRGLLAGATADAPVMLLVEDLHWADALTLDHMAAIARAIAPLPALLVLTSRIAGDPLDAAWRSAASGSALTTMDLGPLREDEALALARSLATVDTQRTRQCIERSGGNPLFLEQLLRDSGDRNGSAIPESIQSLVMARMDRLPAADKFALQAASVIGQRFDLAALREVAGDPGYDCTELLENQLVRADGEHLLFAHALIQEGVYASLVKAGREKLHRRAAHWFEATDPVLFAQHLDRAGDERAPAAYLAAARAEATAYRYEHARRLCARGRAVATAPADLHALACQEGELLLDLGDTGQSVETYQLALDHALTDVHRCIAFIGIAAAHRVSTEYQQALDLLERAEPAARSHGLNVELARLHHLRGNLYFPTGNIDGCREQHALALEYARKCGSIEEEARALGGLGDAAYAAGRMRTAHDHFHRCVHLCREHGFGRIEVAYASMLPFGHLYLLELEQAEQAGLAAVRGAARVGAMRAEMSAHGGLSHLYLSTGRHAQGREHTRRGMALCQALHARVWENMWTLFDAAALHGLGRSDEALRILEPAVERATGAGRQFNAARLFGVLALITGDAQVRDDALARGESMLREGSVSHNHLWFYSFGMDALLAAREWDRVEGYAAALEEFTRGEPLPWSAFHVARGRALAACGHGRRDAALVGELASLLAQARGHGLRPAEPALRAALQAFQCPAPGP